MVIVAIIVSNICNNSTNSSNISNNSSNIRNSTSNCGNVLLKHSLVAAGLNRRRCWSQGWRVLELTIITIIIIVIIIIIATIIPYSH